MAGHADDTGISRRACHSLGILIVILGGCGRIGFDPVDVEADASGHREQIFVEAETGAIDAPFRIVADSTASGGLYVIDDHPEPGVQTEGSAIYQVEVTHSDTYRIWARTRADSHTASFYVSIDDSGPIGFSAQQVSPEWRWSPVTGGASAPLAFELAAGTHEIVFASRASQSILDVFVVTTDANFDLEARAEPYDPATSDATAHRRGDRACRRPPGGKAACPSARGPRAG